MNQIKFAPPTELRERSVRVNSRDMWVLSN